MQPIKRLMEVVSNLASPQACLFALADLRSILPEHSDAAFKTLLSRAVFIREGQLRSRIFVGPCCRQTTAHGA